MRRLTALPLVLLAAIALSAGACGDDTETDTDTDTDSDTDTDTDVLTLSTTAWADGEAIPEKYTCDGDDVSPPLTWTGAPEGTQGYALQLLDPDANDFLHWTVGGLSAATTELSEGASPGGDLPASAWELPNTFGSSIYRGPCPPSEHTYVLTLYALDELVGPPEDGRDFTAYLGDHVLETVTYTGTYER